jgi:hypothetical protein
MLRRAAACARRAAAALPASLASATRAVWAPSAAGASGAAAKAAAAASASALGEPSFDVLRVAPGGAAPEQLFGVAASSLRLAPRDAPLFARTRFCAPPATLTWRGDALYVRLVRALTARRLTRCLPPKPRP